MSFPSFFENLLLHGLEYFNKYYGAYRGQVERNDDPKDRGRVQVRVPAVGHVKVLDVWVDMVSLSAGEDRGVFWPPEVGDTVWVSFEQGNPSKPEGYWGGWFAKDWLPSELSQSSVTLTVDGQSQARTVPEKRGFVTRKGHRLIFNDADGEETVELVWHQSVSDPDRSLSTDRSVGLTSMLTFNENSITLQHSDGSKIVIEDGKIKIDATLVEIAVGADQAAVRGDELIAWLRTHTHGTAWGPSTTPLQTIPSTVLSSVTKLK